MARGEKLLTASDLAALCEVDLKTIHTWVERGRIAHFRTPGRHLRFRAADVADFLRAWGYAVPRELARAGAPTVLVAGSQDSFAHVARAIGEGFSTRLAPHAYDALVMLGAAAAHVVVLDAAALDDGGSVDVVSVLEAVHRATPQAMLIVLGGESLELPAFATRVAARDAQALAAIAATTPGIAPPATAENPAKVAV